MLNLTKEQFETIVTAHCARWHSDTIAMLRLVIFDGLSTYAAAKQYGKKPGALGSQLRRFEKLAENWRIEQFMMNNAPPVDLLNYHSAITKLIGYGYSTQQVSMYLQDTHGINVTVEDIEQHLKNHRTNP